MKLKKYGYDNQVMQEYYNNYSKLTLKTSLFATFYTHETDWNSPQTMLIGAAEALEPLLLAGGVPIMTGS